MLYHFLITQLISSPGLFPSLIVLLGQVMTRMSRDWFGGEGERPSRSNTCYIVLAIWLVVIVIRNLILGSMQRATYCAGGWQWIDNGQVYIKCPDGSIEYPSDRYFNLGTAMTVIGFCFFLYMLIATCRTRAYTRQKYQIRTGSCGGCEDCCCSFWCSCCTVSFRLGFC